MPTTLGSYILKKLQTPPGIWLRQVQGVESRYYRALGSAQQLIQKAREIEQSWLKGIGVTRALQRANPTI